MILESSENSLGEPSLIRTNAKSVAFLKLPNLKFKSAW